jgi:hypothetical protein
MIFQIIGIQWIDPLTQFGVLSTLVLLSSIIAIAGFLLAGVFIRQYNKKFFEVGEIPKGWRYFSIGLLLSALYQLLKVPFTYKWIFGDENIILFLVFQIIAIWFLVYGLKSMIKEISIGG